MRILLLGNYNEVFLDDLNTNTHVVFHFPNRSDKEILEIIPSIDIVVVRSPHIISDEMIKSAAQLKWILRAGSGTDNISPLYKERGIELFCFPENSRSVAELVLGMILSLYRSLNMAHLSMGRGEWMKNQLIGREVFGKTIGIIGYGNIGQILGDLSNGLGMKVIVTDHSSHKSQKREALERVKATVLNLESLLGTADIVVLTVPLTSSTHHIINEQTLGMMKSDALLINVGRGGLVDTAALYNNLKNRLLGGAGLDTHEQEPTSTHPIFELPSVIASPHIGAQTQEAKNRIGTMILLKVKEITELQTKNETKSII
ncbi:D-isomer specific 2-hydroxyacid dehydrogenase family protein [Paenibacillus sp. DR312]|uniref:NAD(P)-dependent oxidoreductase n=1 Tax=Paenibacillus sp. DR312 TaxID=2871175 RepID=UPI001C95D876|nr:NAD(P)-dependent oxidoreductase [Paenibacillus sp. DR312]QZN77690.1 NAD(P)-binding domain-containing protein [Paenibacillus sp. DR312]